MWIVIGIIYLFVGLVIGTAICMGAGDDPMDSDSVLAILAIGVIWPLVLMYILVVFLVRFAINFAKALIEQYTNNQQETEEPHGKL